MKTKFEIDVSALTLQEANSILDKVTEAIEHTIEQNGFAYKLRATGADVTLKYIVSDV